jgi:ATP-dependent DNA helicase RecG
VSTTCVFFGQLFYTINPRSINNPETNELFAVQSTTPCFVRHAGNSMANPLYKYLNQDVSDLRGLGARRVSELKKRGIWTVGDLLLRQPSEYQRFDATVPLCFAKPDSFHTFLVHSSSGLETRYSSRGSRKKRYFVCECTDDTADLTLQWFNSIKGLEDKIAPGRKFWVHGSIKRRRGGFMMAHPKMWPASHDRPPEAEAQYRGFRGASGYWYRTALHQALSQLPEGDWWSESERKERDLLPLRSALHQLHFPKLEHLDNRENIPLAAFRRLQYDYAFGLLFAINRERRRSVDHGSYNYDPPADFSQKIEHNLPFALTPSQNEALQTLREARGQGNRLNHILHGDVGSGKTAVAALLAAHTLENNLQACVVSPTEILARQHYASFRDFFRGHPVGIALLTGNTSAKQRGEVVRHLQSGKIHIVIATHAIFSEDIKFSRLGLTVVDEQHRFGVEQRQAIRLKDPQSDLLVMSATPIPRTMLMSLYGDLKPIPLQQPPSGRLPIATEHLSQRERGAAMSRITEELAKGNKIYFVYPLVEEDEDSEIGSAEAAYQKLAKHFGEETVALLHGQMKEKQKEEAFARFRDGNAKILVATTVIEVGVDVPEATVIVIQHADRFGIAQLHQLRGRVGRSNRQSYCYLISDCEEDTTAYARMQALVQHQDGFKLAEIDFELRGPGDLLGNRQSGGSAHNLFWVLARDHKELARVQGHVEQYLETDPDLETNAILKEYVRRFYTQENVFEGG